MRPLERNDSGQVEESRPKSYRLVAEWAMVHQQDLQVLCGRASKLEPLNRLAPLPHRPRWERADNTTRLLMAILASWFGVLRMKMRRGVTADETRRHALACRRGGRHARPAVDLSDHWRVGPILGDPTAA